MTKNNDEMAHGDTMGDANDSRTASAVAPSAHIDPALLIAAAECVKADNAWLWEGGTQLAALGIDSHDMTRCAEHSGCATVALVEGAKALAPVFADLLSATQAAVRWLEPGPCGAHNCTGCLCEMQIAHDVLVRAIARADGLSPSAREASCTAADPLRHEGNQ